MRLAAILIAALVFVTDAGAFGRRNNNVVVNTPGAQVVVNNNRGFFGGNRTIVNVGRPQFAPRPPFCAPRTVISTPGAFIQVR